MTAVFENADFTGVVINRINQDKGRIYMNTISAFQIIAKRLAISSGIVPYFLEFLFYDFPCFRIFP